MFTTKDIVTAYELEPVGPDAYRAGNVQTGAPVVFGGQMLGQSIVAACIGHEGKTVKTLHTVFARGGDPAKPVEITVDRMHAGRALASSSVTISQGDRICARSLVLLTADEPDVIRHADSYRHGTLPTAEAGDGPVGDGSWEMRVVGDVDINDPDAVGPAELDVLTRITGGPDDPIIDQALLAFSTESFLIGTAMRPHPGVGQAQAHVTLSTGVLTHTLTFHEPCSPAQWLLLSQRSPYAGHGRSYGQGEVFTADGKLVASFVQDSMIRAMSANGPKGL